MFLSSILIVHFHVEIWNRISTHSKVDRWTARVPRNGIKSFPSEWAASRVEDLEAGHLFHQTWWDGWTELARVACQRSAVHSAWNSISVFSCSLEADKEHWSYFSSRSFRFCWRLNWRCKFNSSRFCCNISEHCRYAASQSLKGTCFTAEMISAEFASHRPTASY